MNDILSVERKPQRQKYSNTLVCFYRIKYISFPMAIFQPSKYHNIVLSHGLDFFIVMTLSSIMLKG